VGVSDLQLQCLIMEVLVWSHACETEETLVVPDFFPSVCIGCWQPWNQPRVKCGCVDTDVRHVKCGEILQRLSVDGTSRLGLGLGLESSLGWGWGLELALQFSISICIYIHILHVRHPHPHMCILPVAHEIKHYRLQHYNIIIIKFFN